MIIENYEKHKQEFDILIKALIDDTHQDISKRYGFIRDISYAMVKSIEQAKIYHPSVLYRNADKYAILELYRLISEDIMNIFNYLELYIPLECIIVELFDDYEKCLINSLFSSAANYYNSTQEFNDRFKWFFRFKKPAITEDIKCDIFDLIKYIKFWISMKNSSRKSLMWKL